MIIASGMAMWHIVVNSKKAGIIIGFTVVFLISLFATIENSKEYIDGQAIEFKEAGLFLNAKAGPHDLVLASQPHVFFYANREGKLFESLKQEELEDFEQSVDNFGVTWIVFDERRAGQKYPLLKWLLDADSSRAAQLGWQVVFSKESPRILIWRVR